MRGYPLLQLILVFCLFAAAGLPVWRLTRPDPAPAPTPTPVAVAAPVGNSSIDLSITFAPAPVDFRLSYLGNPVLEGRGPQAEFQGTLHATLPPEGADLALEAHFPASTTGSAAARVRCRFSDGHTTERTIWADAGQPLVELVTVQP